MSNIEWTDATWNPVIGCTPVSPGCLNCYAAKTATRLEKMPHAKDYHPRLVGDGVPYGDRNSIRIAEVKNGRAVFTGDVRTLEHRLMEPLSWKKPRRVFVNSMSDLFHEFVPFDFVDKVFAVMALCPQHTFQVLTKRPERMAEYLTRDHDRRVDAITHAIHGVRHGASQKKHYERNLDNTNEWLSRNYPAGSPLPLPNVWIGTSVENQQVADERIPHLLRCPAAVRFLSCEPLLGPVTLHGQGWLTDALDDDAMGCEHQIHWVIVGGESGPKSRPCDVAWIESIIRQCADAGVPCFNKQLGAHVLCANDRVQDWIDEVGLSLDYFDEPADAKVYQGAPIRMRLSHSKGGEPAEWPARLRVRQMPGGAAC